MCIYNEILATDTMALLSQAVTIIAIFLSALVWLFLFHKQKLPERLRIAALPLILWIIFGTLDIVITAKGTYDNAAREANPATRSLLEQFGMFGPAVASILWIGLWVGIVFLVLKFMKNTQIADVIALVIFYSLAAAHFTGFSTWFIPFCGIAKIIKFEGYWIIPGIVSIKFMVIGVVLSIIHTTILKILQHQK